VRERLASWRGLLTGHVQDGRELFRHVLDGPIRFRPDAEHREYHFEGEVRLGRLLMGVAGLAPFLASPTGFVLSYQPVFQGIWVSDRKAA
jgi:hypothetical protein